MSCESHRDVCSGGGGVLSGLQFVVPSGALRKTLLPTSGGKCCAGILESTVDLNGSGLKTLDYMSERPICSHLSFSFFK